MFLMNTDSLAQCSSYFSSIFDSIGNRSSKNYKIPKKKETTTLRCGSIRKKKQFPRFPSFRLCPIPKIGNSENLILLKFLIILRMLIFLVVYETQNRKNDLKYGLRRKHVRFRGFRVFDFALYLKSKTWRPRKVFVYFIQFFIFLVASYGCIKHGKD